MVYNGDTQRVLDNIVDWACHNKFQGLIESATDTLVDTGLHMSESTFSRLQSCMLHKDISGFRYGNIDACIEVIMCFAEFVSTLFLHLRYNVQLIVYIYCTCTQLLCALKI